MTLPTVMRALQQASFEGPQGLRLISDAPVPVPAVHELLIRVAAAGVNFADISRAYGTFRDGPQPPFLAGFEAAGQVVAVGEDVSASRRGTLVVGVGYGAFSEYMLIPAAAAVPVPVGWKAEQALGLVVNWPTALAALKTLGRIAAGEAVLIHAAAGATGQAAVAMAKHYGATVIATASPSKHATVRAVGADQVLDARSGDLAAQVLQLTAGAGAEPRPRISRRRHVSSQLSSGKARHGKGRRLRPGRRGRHDQQLGSRVQAPASRHRTQYRCADPGRTATVR